MRLDLSIVAQQARGNECFILRTVLRDVTLDKSDLEAVVKTGYNKERLEDRLSQLLANHASYISEYIVGQAWKGEPVQVDQQEWFDFKDYPDHFIRFKPGDVVVFKLKDGSLTHFLIDNRTQVGSYKPPVSACLFFTVIKGGSHVTTG